MLKSVDLVWIVVSDIKKAKKFFVETLGLREHSSSEEYGWTELCGQDGGTMIGIAQESDFNEIQAGQNAVITITVDNIDETVALFKKKNIKLLGEILEVPGHAKMQLFADEDGNKFQIVQVL